MKNEPYCEEISNKQECVSEIQLKKTKVYAGRINDAKELYISSSGGAFTALTNLFLSHHDAVV